MAQKWGIFASCLTASRRRGRVLRGAVAPLSGLATGNPLHTNLTNDTNSCSLSFVAGSENSTF